MKVYVQEMTELKPCPFCGCDAEGLETMPLGDDGSCAYVYCYGCGGQGPDGTTLEEAVQKWNKRNSEEIK